MPAKLGTASARAKLAAELQGDLYYLGHTCKRGHTDGWNAGSIRYTATGRCVECYRLRNQRRPSRARGNQT